MAYIDHVGDVVRVSAYMAYPNNQVQVMTHHFKCLAAGPNDTRGLLGNFIRDQIISKFMNTIPAAVYFPGTLVHLVSASLKYLPTVSPSNMSGTATGVLIPTQSRAVLRWETDFSGPGGRGRNYIFTPAEGYSNLTGHPAQSYIDVINTYGLAINAPQVYTGTTWQHGLWSRPKASDPDGAFSIFTNLQAMGKWGTQRRSGDYGKINVVPPEFPPKP